MRLHRLHVVDFATIGSADIEFGPGLNVLYGPNDLGKSTLADAIRLAFLLPHTSTHIDDYVPWAGGRNPVVEMTFQTEPQRFWRVRKEFRVGGTALLQESKNGVDFDDVERARKVDGRLRDLLRWGIPEPGGAGGSKGLPTSFLATVLLSTQSNVASVLRDSLQRDPSGTGKERIAAALQAVAQDPLFTALLRATQARRDEAFTERGAKKTAKGSVFKAAADLLNQTREERERLQDAVNDSEGVERQLRDLTAKRGQLEEEVATTTERLTTLEQLVAQAADLAASAEQVRVAREEVLRIQLIGSDVDAAERGLGELVTGVQGAEEALKLALAWKAQADATIKSVEEATRAPGSDPAVTDALTRQGLELRRVAADQALKEAQQQIDRADAAQRLVDAATVADDEQRARRTESDKASATLSDAAANERSADEHLRRVELLARALDTRAAEERASAAQADVDLDAALRARREGEVAEREVLAQRRAAIVVPAPDALISIRRLAQDLAGARGALNVGLVVTVTPNRPTDIRVKADGVLGDSALTDKALDVEANAEVDIDIGDVATVRIRAGRREAQQIAESLEARWSREVAPLLAAANVADLDGLDAQIKEAQALDANVKDKDARLQTLEVQIASLADSTEKLRKALDRRSTSRAALGDVPLETLASDLAALGADPTSALQERRRLASGALELARQTANAARTAHTVAEERTRHSGSTLDAAVLARDAVLAAFGDGVDATLTSARAAIASSIDEQLKITAAFTSLESTLAAEHERIEVALREARAGAEEAQVRLEAAQMNRTKAMTDHASQVGRLEGLRRLRDAQDLATAEKRLQDATDRHAAVPAPERPVTTIEVTAAQNAKTTAITDLGGIEREIQRTHGALEQVGGAVARERLRDAIEAFEAAERVERELEADYDAWSLLLDQMKQADAAQASNLGQALAPAIAGKFEAMTNRRYDSIRLTAELGTEGVMVAGSVRSMDRISVGTREQLSTLYRLSLAEYLSTTVVLDDQLVQSDQTRMEWFRSLLVEKAHSFQIVVFTCRPSDYLPATAMVPEGNDPHFDTADGFVRAVDLGRAVRER